MKTEIVIIEYLDFQGGTALQNQYSKVILKIVRSRLKLPFTNFFILFIRALYSY
jgi:hypothetical protein